MSRGKSSYGLVNVSELLRLMGAGARQPASDGNTYQC